jgi:phospholipase D1/2
MSSIRTIGWYLDLVDYANLRHDEEHEIATDNKRTAKIDEHRFKSFAPEREGNTVKWYVDGRDYLWALSIALERAKETIFIQDWWLSPELFLRRPPHQNRHWRLDKVLKRKAEQGVKIYVIVYKEVEEAITCNSDHTKKALRALCKPGEPGHGNIIVMRHPDHSFVENGADGHFYFSHHQKQCIIDRKVAYVGGIDLCYGRWDMHQHPMADVHPAGVAQELWPGQDFNNNRIKDFEKVQDWKENSVSKAENGRMPWHDIHLGLIGPSVYDLVEHFILRWNFIKRDKYKRDKRFDWLLLEGREGEDEDLIGVQRPKYPVGKYIPFSVPKPPVTDGGVNVQVLRSAADWSSGVLLEKSIQNAYSELIEQAEHYVYIENQFFITATGEEQNPIKNTVGRAIVNAVLRAEKENRKFRVIILIPAVPGFAGDLRDSAANGTRAIMDYQYKSLNRGEHSIFGQIKAANVDPHKYIFVFNLRTFDRLHTSEEMKQTEEKTGIPYQDIERAHAAEVMGEKGATSSKGFDKNENRDEILAKKEQFEGTNDPQEGKIGDGNQGSEDSKEVKDSIAGTNMLHQPKLVNEKWDGKPGTEKDNFVQEELYIHAKLMIIDGESPHLGIPDF